MTAAANALPYLLQAADSHLTENDFVSVQHSLANPGFKVYASFSLCTNFPSAVFDYIYPQLLYVYTREKKSELLSRKLAHGGTNVSANRVLGSTLAFRCVV